MLFYCIAICFVAGLALGINLSTSFIFCIIGIFVIIFSILWIESRTPKFVLIGGCLLLFGACYGNLYVLNHQPNSNLQAKVGQKVELKGIVLDEPVQKEKASEIIARTDFGKILIFANSYPKVSYGDEIAFKGKLKIPEPFQTDSGRTFNYPGYLSKGGIFFIESYPAITVISSHNGNYFKEKLFNFKNSITRGMEKVVPYPESALLEGITVAGKRALPENINNDFKRAGVSHIVVLSGYNVTIVALVIMSILSPFPRIISFSAGTLGIIAFCLLTGGTSTIVRAGIMSFLYLLARFTRREIDPNRLLAIAGCLMILQNPLILLHDSSFHLSFLATVGLINISPIIDRRLDIIPRSSLREIISASLGVEIFLIPYLAYAMGNISVVGLISNILLLSFIPFTMLAGFMSSAFSFTNIHLAKIMAFVSFIFLRYELGITHLMSSFPFALMKTAVPFWVPAVFYSSALMIFMIRRIFEERRANSDSQKMLQHTSSSLTVGNPAYMSVPTYRVPE